MNAVQAQGVSTFLSSWLDFKFRQCNFTGLSVAVYSGDGYIFSNTYGEADADLRVPLRSDHIFNAASQTKMVTATAIMQLVERSKLQLDDPVCNYVRWLCDYPDKRVREITIRQLLSHSSGLIRDGDDAAYWLRTSPFPNQQQLRNIVLRSRLTTAPGTELKYSNLGYCILGVVVARASGLSFNTYIQRNILDRLPTDDIYPDYRPSIRDRLVTNYGSELDHVRPAFDAAFTTNALSPGVGIRATAAAMCSFAAAHFIGNTSLLSDESKREMHREHVYIEDGYDEGASFGLGFQVMSVGDRRCIGHTGHVTGGVGATFFDPKAKVAVAVMANCRDMPTTQIALGVYQVIDFYTQYGAQAMPKQFDHLNVRTTNEISSVEIVATKQRIVALDPNSWEPFSLVEELEPTSVNALRITTPGSLFNKGEVIDVRLRQGKVKAISFSGTPMLPYDAVSRPDPTDLPVYSPDDIAHMPTRLGKILSIEPDAKEVGAYTVVVNVGQEFGGVTVHINGLPHYINYRSLGGRLAMCVILHSWRHSTPQIHLVGISTRGAVGALPGILVNPQPDSAFPAVFSRSGAHDHWFRRLGAGAQHIFHLQPSATYDYSDQPIQESLSLWLAGYKADSLRMLRETFYRSDAVWLQAAQSDVANLSRRVMRVRVIDDEISPFVQWEIEFFKLFHIPLVHEAVYLLPRTVLDAHNIPIPEADDVIVFDNEQALISELSNGEWSHSTYCDTSHPKDFDYLLSLKSTIMRLAVQQGYRVQTSW